MYAVKVKVQDSKELPPSASNTPVETSSQQRDVDPDAVLEVLQVSAGNPRVEHITGLVHLYREVAPQGDPTASSSTALPMAEPGERLCVLALPADMGVSDFCQFVGGYLPRVQDMRFVRREDKQSVCLVLLTLDSKQAASEFYQHYNNQPFSCLEPEVLCRLVFVREVDFTSGVEEDALLPPAGLTELPTCPVCLERLDAHISGIVTTVCNHKFHNECLRKWGDTSCPVCRYCQQSDATTSHCTVCDTSTDLWICLICGHIGCGRYRDAHAVDHWKTTGHCYALELETQRVWDYAGDGYVHRLIQSKTDGKLVEVPSPQPAGAGSGDQSCSSRSAPLEPEVEEALVVSKLEAIAAEYNHLLVGQLDAQRHFYEGLLAKAQAEAEARCAAAESGAGKSAAQAQAAQAAVAEADRGRKAAEKKLHELAAKFREVQKEREIYEALNQQLRTNQQSLKADLAATKEAAAQAMADKDAQMQELNEQVRDLMMYLEAQKVFQGDGAGELQSATLLPLPEPPPVQAPKRRTPRKPR